jgi:hypothetical protein
MFLWMNCPSESGQLGTSGFKWQNLPDAWSGLMSHSSLITFQTVFIFELLFLISMVVAWPHSTFTLKFWLSNYTCYLFWSWCVGDNCFSSLHSFVPALPWTHPCQVSSEIFKTGVNWIWGMIPFGKEWYL